MWTTGNRNRLHWPGWFCRLLKMDAYGNLPRWWQWFFPRWGNYGCPGWSGGRWCRSPEETDWSVAAIDAMDEMCKRHDQAYQDGSDRDAADLDLVRGLAGIRPGTWYGNFYRLLAITAFTAWPKMRSFLGRVTMKRIVLALLVMVGVLFISMHAFGLEVPGITPQDFAGDTSPEAAAIWSILGGQGPWGVLLFAILGVVWKFTKPYLDAWMAARRLDRLMLAIEAGVGGTMAVYVDAIKAGREDGKLTEEEAKAAREKAKAFIIAFMKAQGIDVVKDYGHAVLDYLIEYILAKVKVENAAMVSVVKAVAAPLPELAP